MSQETFIYDPRAKSVLSVFYFLIKKELMFFTNGGLCSLRVGRSYLQLKKLSTI